MPIITIEQIRAARGLLDWSQIDLAEHAGISVPTIKRLEAEFGPPVSDDVRKKIRWALEKAGIEFIDDDDGEGLGVRLRKGPKKKT